MKQTLLIAFIGLTSLLYSQAIDIRQLKINGTIGCSLTLNELLTSNIKIDSIKPTPEVMDMSTADSLIYVGRTYFEYYANSNKCVLKVIQFDSRISEVRIGNLTLNNQTSIELIQESFPEDWHSTNPIKLYQDLTSYRTCGIPILANGKLIDPKLLFFFLDGKLTRIDIWEPS
jgi:hypothetical protein